MRECRPRAAAVPELCKEHGPLWRARGGPECRVWLVSSSAHDRLSAGSTHSNVTQSTGSWRRISVCLFCKVQHVTSCSIRRRYACPVVKGALGTCRMLGWPPEISVRSSQVSLHVWLPWLHVVRCCLQCCLCQAGAVPDVCCGQANVLQPAHSRGSHRGGSAVW